MTPPPSAPRKSLSQKTLSGSLWSLAGTGSQTLLRVGVLILLARLLTPEIFGVVTVSLIIVNFLDLFNLLGVGPAIVQKAVLTDDDTGTAFTVATLMGLVTGAIVAAAAPLFADFFRMPALYSIIPVLALNFPIKGAATVASALLQRKMRFRDIALVTVASYVVGYAFVAVCLAMLGFGVWALVFGQLAQSVLHCAGYLWFSRPRLQLRLNPATVGHLLRFGSGYSLARLGSFIATNGDNFLVGRLLGAASLGIYSRAYQFLLLPTNLVGNAIDQVLFAAMAEARENPQRLARAYERALAVVVMVMLPGSAILIALAPHIVLGLLGPQWAQAVLPFQFLAVAMVCRSGYKVSDALWRAKGVVFAGAWRQWLYAGEVLAGAWIGSAWGVNGVAVGVGIAITLHYIVMLIFARQMTDVSLPAVFLTHLRYTLVAGVCGFTVWVAARAGENAGGHLLALAAGGLAGAATLGLLWFLLPGLFGQERRWIIGEGRTLLTRRMKANDAGSLTGEL